MTFQQIKAQLKELWRRHVMDMAPPDISEVDIELPSDREFEQTKPFEILTQEL